MTRNYSILVFSYGEKMSWHQVLRRALISLGKLEFLSNQDIFQVVKNGEFDLIIIDSLDLNNEFWITSKLRDIRPAQKIVIASDSRTWRRAREAFLAGAVDYIIKSQDEKKLRNQILEILELPQGDLENEIVN